MRIASWARVTYVVSIVSGCAAAVAACGGSGRDSGFTGGGLDATFDVASGDGGSLLGDGSSGCQPKTCASAGYTCGMNGDGCGGVIDCGGCTAGQFCGGAGYSKCGDGEGPDGSTVGHCVPETCASLGNYDCGKAGDGCGGVLDCGTCTAPQYCGGGGFSVCGGTGGHTADGGNFCIPLAACPGGYDCGEISDGCGGLLKCGGACPTGQVCGAGGFDRCGVTGLGSDGGPKCTPATCSNAPGGPYTCGQVGDGCGGLTAHCGTCSAPEFCGGGGASKCGPTSIGTCDGGGGTTVSGTVYDPGGHVPVFNALVYVPSGPVVQPDAGATCGCPAPPAIVSTTTAVDGSFTLHNVPAGASVQVVVQLGKWQITYAEPVTACVPNPVGMLKLPSKHATTATWPPTKPGEGNIPLFAIDTGNVDSMECVLLKMGLDQGEFVNPVFTSGLPQAGRVHFYQGNTVTGAAVIDGSPKGGAVIDGSTPSEDGLTGVAKTLDRYDAVLFPCKEGSATQTPTKLANVLDYANAGGRVFATHYSYEWLFQNVSGKGGFASTASWDIRSGGNSKCSPKTTGHDCEFGDTNVFTGHVDESFTRGSDLAHWLSQAAVYGGSGCAAFPGACSIPVDEVRWDFDAVNAPAQRWMYSTAPPDTAAIPLHFTFDTPFDETATCGRVVYSDFHVENAEGLSGGGSHDYVFPSECASGALTPQEKLLEFMLFDLTSCVSPPTCQKLTCASYPPGTCGPQGDGCGGTTPDCGSCASGTSCGGGGTPGKCGAPDGGKCVPKTCADYPGVCGPQGDGCGGATPDCNPCKPPLTCGGGGVSGKCGEADGGHCVPQACPSNIHCGQAADGCGGLVTCGACPTGQACGGGGVAGECGSPDGGICTPLTCSQLGLGCGPAGDGCGNLIQCGSCTGMQTCGGGGTPGQCGGGSQ